jgi:hypothetical protein
MIRSPVAAVCLRRGCGGSGILHQTPHIRHLRRVKCPHCGGKQLEFRWREGRRRTVIRRVRRQGNNLVDLGRFTQAEMAVLAAKAQRKESK